LKPLFINIHAELSVLNEINLKLSDAAGTTLKAEFYMRLIGQFSLKVRTALIDIIAKLPTKPRKSNYWDCNLQYLDEAIEQVFQSSLSQEEIEKLSKTGDPHSYPFKAPCVKGFPYNFSFSGLKTKILLFFAINFSPKRFIN
jgi:hypothetical protein